MKAQSYPASIIKKGVVLYQVLVFTDEDKTEIAIEEWVVRSIKRKPGSQTRYGYAQPMAGFSSQRVYVVHKVKFVTWGKRSNKHGDFGWLPGVPSDFRTWFSVGDDLPAGLYTTKRAALKYAADAKVTSLKRCYILQKEETDPEEIAEWKTELEDMEKELKLLKSRIKRISNTK